MTLPNLFLADQPAEAELSSTMIREACLALKRNRAATLANCTTPHLVNVLGEVAANWLREEDPIHKLALNLGPDQTRFSKPVLAKGLHTFFKSITPASLDALVTQDLGHPSRLDQFVASEAEQHGHREALASGPEMLVHITAGNLPCPALSHMILGLLARSAQFVKCASGTSLLPRLFAHSIHGVEPRLGACLEIAEWPGGKREDLESVLYEEADCLTVTGSDETLAQIQSRLNQQAVPPRMIGHGAKVSFAFLAAQSLTRFNLAQLAASAAQDILMWDQQGCLSPHVFYVQEGGAAQPIQFAESLAAALEQGEATAPRGKLSVEETALIRSRRDIHQIRAAHDKSTLLWMSADSTAWTVVFESDPLFQLSPLNRFAYVKPVPDLTQALQAADRIRSRVSTVGLAAPRGQAGELALQLARWGAPRVCPLGQMQQPPMGWRHDGRPALEDLIRWTDWEHAAP